MLMSYKLIGKNFTPSDLEAKVTGRAKYSEDFRAEGMLFAKLYLSPMPHAKVVKIDVSEALKMKGVAGVLTADDLKEVPPGGNPILTNWRICQGDCLSLLQTSCLVRIDFQIR